MRVTARCKDRPTDAQKFDLGLFLGEYMFATPGGTQVDARLDSEQNESVIEVVFDHDYVDMVDFERNVLALKRSWDVNTEINEYFLTNEKPGELSASAAAGLFLGKEPSRG